MESVKLLKANRPGAGDASSEQAVVEPAPLAGVQVPNHAGKSKPHSSKDMSKKKQKRSSKSAPHRNASDSSSQDDSGSDDSDDSDSSDSSIDVKLMRMLKKRRAARKKSKAKSRKSKRAVSSSSSSDSLESSESSDDGTDDEADSRDSYSDVSSARPRRRRRGKSSRHQDIGYTPGMQPHDFAALTIAALQAQNQLRAPQALPPPPPPQKSLFPSVAGDAGGHSQLDDVSGLPQLPPVPPMPQLGTAGVAPAHGGGRHGKNKKKHGKGKRGATLDFKRVDQLWDRTIHDYKLTERAEAQEKTFDGFVFTVRRKFDWQNKYKSTVVDIKSKRLRDVLQVVLADAKGVSLVEDEPSIEPNMLFLYVDELHQYCKKTLKDKAKTEKKKKLRKRFEAQRAECKLLLKYLNEDYADVRKRLIPMVKAGNITFDLVWALFKPNTIAYASTYGSSEHPRCFKVDYSTKNSDFTRGEWYGIEGRYLEYDGKSFGLGDLEIDIPSFKGPRKITSLATYPLEYHSDPDRVRSQLIERGKRFVALEGMNYRFHKGLAFFKKRRHIVKINVNGRIMIDPAIFRRINPNYPISTPKTKDSPLDLDEDEEDEDGGGCGQDDDAPDTKLKVIVGEDDLPKLVEVPVDADGNETRPEKLDVIADTGESKAKHEFTDEELLIASPVVLGFSFNEKLWLEFSLSGVRDIEWDEGAFASLVLPESHKSIVKALVESHKFHAAKTIDDVIQGKGKGLVAVLHGPPGTGKTLTAEGIAELLRCPLYMVSAGELGTDSRRLEGDLQNIMDLAHSWGAVLLLDEADVFLEKREVHDIHRNALVSIFLRLLEYFQGILFLTTNRVETFDDAFQSRIHVALRYGELSPKAKKAVWRMFLERVRQMEGVKSVEWSDDELETLSRKPMNGRQIKNAVRTAQALAVNNDEELSMRHLRHVLDVAQSFDQDLRGGTGYVDAMRSYT